MRSWIERADKRLRKVRALLNLKHMKNKRILAKRFGTWVDETNFLITLEQRVDSLKKKGKLQTQINLLNLEGPSYCKVNPLLQSKTIIQAKKIRCH